MANTYLLLDQKQKGPYSEEEIQEMYTAGTITAQTLYWKEGMSDWQALGLVKAQTNPHPAVKTIAPPRRTQNPGQSRNYSVEPKKKSLEGDSLSARFKLITLTRAVGLLLLFFLVLSILLGLLMLTVPDAGKEFAARVAAASNKKQ